MAGVQEYPMIEKQKSGGILEGLVGMFRRDDDEQPAELSEPKTGFSASAEALGDLLTELSEQAEERRQAQRQREAVASGRLGHIDKDEREDIKRQRMEEIHAEVRASVVATHEQLRTGIDDVELTELDGFMDRLCEMMAAPAAAGLEPYIRGAITRRFYDETGPLAWQRLTELMDDAGTEWPSPEEHQREHKRAEAAELFVHASPTVTAALVSGVVPIWQDHYPKKDSALWQSVCFRAAGAGLRARMLGRAMDYLRAHSPELRAEGERLLREKISTVQDVLSSGLRSVDEADQVMAGAAGLLERVLPDLCWDRARDVVTAES
jgi:hypothetical protein